MSILGRLTNLGKGVLRSHLSPEEDPPLHLADEPLRRRAKPAPEAIREASGEGVEARPPDEPLERTLGEARPAGKPAAEPAPRRDSGEEPPPVKRTL